MKPQVTLALSLNINETDKEKKVFIAFRENGKG
jgi:hypothetical protein